MWEIGSPAFSSNRLSKFSIEPSGLRSQFRQRPSELAIAFIALNTPSCLDAYFDVIVISCEVGATKPDRRIFEIAARRLGLALGEILHVGDSAAMDLRGARAAGLRALLLQRSSRRSAAGCIRSLAELPAVARGGESLPTMIGLKSECRL